jgi:hypothetical protein
MMPEKRRPGTAADEPSAASWLRFEQAPEAKNPAVAGFHVQATGAY